MDINYFPDEELNTLPCGVVAFQNHAPWKIIHANDIYFSQFSGGNSETLNIIDEDAPRLNSLAPRLSHGEKTANLLYRTPGTGTDEKRIVMSAALYGDGAFLGVLWDATDRAKMLDEVEAEKEKFAMALCNSKNVVFEHNLKKDTQVFYVPNLSNNTVETIKKSSGETGIPPEAVHPEYREFFLANVYNPEEGMLAAKLRLPCDDDYKWYRVSRQFEYDDEGNLSRVYGVMIDIEEEKQAEEERRHAAEIDPATKIYYRNAAVKRIETYLAQNSDRNDYALMVMDIDNFKDINDTYGHLYGDTVIEMVASVLKDIRPNFSIPGRYGGDEFFIFLHAADVKEVKDTADQILLKLLDFRLTNGGNVTCSIGIATGDMFDSVRDYKTLFEKADKALYAAKKNGKAQWQMYNPDMEESSGRAIDYEADDESNTELMESKDLMKVFLELSSAAKTSEDAIYSIIKYITAKFDFDWMQVMQVNSRDDLITIRYEWSRDAQFRNNAGKSGYYVHSDIMLFRNYFEKHPVFEVVPANIEGFSPKFQREFEKNMKYNIIYISDTTADENFYMFTCVRFEKDRVWSQEEMDGLNIATKIMTMFIAQTSKESEKEKELQRLVDSDKRTGLYNIDKFYEQLGRLRKLAAERDEEIVIFHTEFGNMMELNLQYGYRAGDDLISGFGDFLLRNADRDRTVSGHVNGTDQFLSAFRIPHDGYGLIKKYRGEYERFCNQQNEKYPGVNLVIRTGAYVLENGEEGGMGFDKAYFAIKREKDRDRCMFEWYEDKTKEKLPI